MNANQRRKARRKGIFSKKDKGLADRLATSLWKLDLSDARGLYSGWADYTYSLSQSFGASYGNWYSTNIDLQGEVLSVEHLEVALKSITFDTKR